MLVKHRLIYYASAINRRVLAGFRARNIPLYGGVAAAPAADGVVALMNCPKVTGEAADGVVSPPTIPDCPTSPHQRTYSPLRRGGFGAANATTKTGWSCFPRNPHSPRRRLSQAIGGCVALRVDGTATRWRILRNCRPPAGEARLAPTIPDCVLLRKSRRSQATSLLI
jgi:hypothetical protein